ncbi:MAG: helix-turn-helix transcriptional regulator [Muribaculaceae bacterium]
METINDRMEILVNERFGGNKAAFANKIGLPPTGLSNYLGSKRRSKPSVDMVVSIITALDVDALWLLTGDNSKGTKAIVNGDSSVAAINSHVSVGDVAILKEKINSLEQLVSEKERLINVLMDGRK